MSLHITANTPFRVTTNTYNAGGVGQAVLPFTSTELLAASATNVNYFDIRPTNLTVDGTMEIHLSDDGLLDDADCDVTITRPFGGEEMAGLNSLRALQIHLTADEVSTAELDAGVTGPRTTSVSYLITNVAGSTTFAKGILHVSAAEDVASFATINPETYGADIKISFLFDIFSLKTRLQLLTVAE